LTLAAVSTRSQAAAKISAAESLPELDVEIPACILSADYTRHHKPIRHAPIIALKSDAPGTNPSWNEGLTTPNSP
jgi:hypothetical protein